MQATAPKKSIKEQRELLVKYLSSVTTEDVFPAKNKKAAENLRKAGLIK